MASMGGALAVGPFFATIQTLVLLADACRQLRSCILFSNLIGLGLRAAGGGSIERCAAAAVRGAVPALCIVGFVSRVFSGPPGTCGTPVETVTRNLQAVQDAHQ